MLFIVRGLSIINLFEEISVDAENDREYSYQQNEVFVFRPYGPLVKDGFHFLSYTDTIDGCDGDFLTKDTTVILR